MKSPRILIVAAFALLATAACNKKPDIEKKISELEQKNIQAEQRQRDLERQLEDQRIAVERDAIERERAQIEEDRAELERQQGEDVAARDQALRDREAAIATRENTLERSQSDFGEQEDELQQNAAKLSERERELAGREALAIDVADETAPVADYGTFYDSLSSYGSWFETRDFGYVWQPAIIHDLSWRPYSRGRWICSDHGWTWLSDEPFGWATYHYGRWAQLRDRGWIWVPGGEWAPCWVSWRENDSHIGWAPLPPETLAYRGHAWDSTVDVRFGISPAWFNFVAIRDFDRPIHGHCLPISNNITFISQTTNITFVHIVNQQVICGGPQYQQVCHRIGRTMPFCRLEIDRHAPDGHDRVIGLNHHFDNGRLRIAAPNVNADWNERLRPAHVKGDIETVSIARDKDVDREISDRFHRNRDEERNRADEAIDKLGGPQRFEEGRGKQLQDNRRKAGGSREEIARKEIPAVKLSERGDKPEVALRENGSVGAREDGPRRQDQAAEANNDKPRKVIAAGDTRREDQRKPAIENPPAKGADLASDEAARRVEAAKARQELIERQREENRTRLAQQKAEELQRQAAANGGTPRDQGQMERPDSDPQVPQKDAGKNQQLEARQKALDEARQKMQDDTARRTQDELRQKVQDDRQQKLQDDARRQQDDARELARQQQARQQQEMQRRQQDQAREQQQEQIKRQQDQARQQQQEQARQQQEQARQQQQEQARQQQQEQARQQQEQARRQQQEQARQQQQEQARQQQQEQAREQQREQARQQQQEQARQQQQEQSRQRQQKDEEDRRKK